MQYYPIFIDLKNKPCLVVGAGDVAQRKIRLMCSAGADITVIATTISPSIRDEFGDQLNYKERKFLESDVQNYRLITAATDDPKVNRRVSELAQANNIPVNVVDQPELCSFITPASVNRSPIQIAISSGGAAPVLVRKVRSIIESIIPANYGKLATLMGKYRDDVRAKLAGEKEVRLFWDKVLDGPISEVILNGAEEAGERALRQAIKAPQAQSRQGEVSLIGAGPGDPDLLTFRALRLLQRADVVLYDRLVSSEIVDMCRRDAERIYVGKRRTEHTLPQVEINQLLVDLAKQGKNVARLKGGDPFIFGRGGEELELLSQSEIAFQVVPGITAASGCASYAGIPLTHRDHAQSCMFVTGHLKDDTVDLDWELLSRPNQTVVVYMGLVGLPHITKHLIEHGVSKNMPIALIERGTTPEQRVFVGTLENINEEVKCFRVHAPTILIIGTVVNLQEGLSWFNT